MEQKPESVERLEKLYQRDTAKKVEKIGYAFYCPSCHAFKEGLLSARFCRWCGQRLDWSKE